MSGGGNLKIIQKNIVLSVDLFIQAIRVRSWLSWLFIFGLGSTLFAFPVPNTIFIGISFCSITASIFVANQYFDMESDKLNHKKNTLPFASGQISNKVALFLFVALLIIGLLLTTVVDIGLVPLLVLYFGLWLAYSVSPLNLKKRPVMDLIVAGLGAGILPFSIGLQVSHQLTMDFALPWIVKRYQDTLLCIVPLFLFQVSGHIFQAIGDFEADKNARITTSVVKYGKEKAAKIGAVLFSLSAILPLIYGLLNLSITQEFLQWYLLFFIIFLPFIIYLLNLFRKPIKQNIAFIYQISSRTSPLLLLILFCCIIILRTLLK